MNFKNFLFFIVALTTLSTVFTYFLKSPSSSPVVSIQAQQQALNLGETYRPDFELPDLKGNIHKNSEWDGKVIVVNFWATWCPPCLKEIPVFVELQKRYGKNGLQFVGIAIDKADEVTDFVDTLAINYPVLISEYDGIAISQAFGNYLGALPFTAVVNREGKIVFRRAGEIDSRMAEKEILSVVLNKK
jgi:thiol-disulfide isomerase/thioredoxin